MGLQELQILTSKPWNLSLKLSLFKKQDNEKELFKLQEKIIKGTYNPCPYQYFTIHDPKRRQIAVAPFKDRVVHHAVVNILEPVFEKSFIFYSYASRRGKGTRKAIEQAQKFIRKRPWYVKIFINILIDKILPLIYHYITILIIFCLLKRYEIYFKNATGNFRRSR